MGADAPIPPFMMTAAAVQDFLMKIFSTAFGCPHGGAPAAASIPFFPETELAPPWLEEPDGSSHASFLQNEASRRGPEEGALPISGIHKIFIVRM